MLILDTACLGLFPFFFLLFIFPTFLLLHFMSWRSGILLFLGPAPEGSHCIPLGPTASHWRVWGCLLPTLYAESGLFPFPSSLLLQAFAFLTLFPLQEFLLVISQMPVLPPVLLWWDSSCRGRKTSLPVTFFHLCTAGICLRAHSFVSGCGFVLHVAVGLEGGGERGAESLSRHCQQPVCVCFCTRCG